MHTSHTRCDKADSVCSSVRKKGNMRWQADAKHGARDTGARSQLAVPHKIAHALTTGCSRAPLTEGQQRHMTKEAHSRSLKIVGDMLDRRFSSHAGWWQRHSCCAAAQSCQAIEGHLYTHPDLDPFHLCWRHPGCCHTSSQAVQPPPRGLRHAGQRVALSPADCYRRSRKFKPPRRRPGRCPRPAG